MTGTGSGWMRWAPLLLVPVALAAGHMEGLGAPLKFLLAAMAIIPVARLIGQSTVNLAPYTGESVGALLNATFGNLPELIICLVALKAGLYTMVAASLVGAILFNLLLVLGLAFLLGGLRHHTLDFNAKAVRVYSTMMFIAVISMALPSLYEHAFAADGDVLNLQRLNVAIAVLLLALFALYLVFMVKTHPEEFASHGGDAHGEHDGWGLGRCVGTLVGASVLAALLSEVLVAAVEGTGEALGLPPTFVGIVLLASVGGVGEGIPAVALARKGRFDLAIGIAMGSCILIAIFVSPVLVLASYAIGPHPFQLSFGTGAVTLLFLVVLIGSIVAAGGSGNWYKGVQLLAVYLMIAVLLYFTPG